jgi:hypothetical protein
MFAGSNPEFEKFAALVQHVVPGELITDENYLTPHLWIRHELQRLAMEGDQVPIEFPAPP